MTEHIGEMKHDQKFDHRLRNSYAMPNAEAMPCQMLNLDANPAYNKK